MTELRLASRIAELQKSLQAADGEQPGSFSKVFGEFMDITGSTSLIRDSKSAKDPVVKEALLRAAREVAGAESASMERLMMLSCPAAGILHGGFFVAGLMGSFFFFPKEGQGLLALAAGGPMMHYCRVTTTELPKGTTPMRRPRGVQ